eukprot:TRINITY_DN2380_c0_g1_i1.p1 TRINITY_DN2380_c0_g1~~TRINITY_DN2380_c0_g1_i1.p1  ORF type:complete len:658 (-),score=139.40 TRINITY_DN2380_c0_g1_i1:104-2077(-)
MRVDLSKTNNWFDTFEDKVEPVFDFVHNLRFEFGFCAALFFLWVTRRYRVRRGGANAKYLRPKGFSANLTSPNENGEQEENEGRALWLPVLSEEDISALQERQVSAEKLCDASWLLPRLAVFAGHHPESALELYRSAIAAGLCMPSAPCAERDRSLSALVLALARSGRARAAIQVVREVTYDVPGVGAALYGPLIKVLTAKHLLNEAIDVYRLMVKDSSCRVSDKATWSCLLFAMVETSAAENADICLQLFGKVKACGQPAQKDYWNVMRVLSVKGDGLTMFSLLKEMAECGVEADSVIYNTAFSAFVAMDRFECAKNLLTEMACKGVADVITYNTLMKGYARQGNMEECYALYVKMRKAGIQASQVTYGILLDGWINVRMVERAMDVFEDMLREGCTMNTVLCTTLIKGFAREGKVVEAMRVYDQMMNDGGSKPDLITFSVLLKANCDAGKMEVALGLLDTIKKMGLIPDEVVFNNLLSGAANQANEELANQLYRDMVSSGVAPSNATFSIMIRLYAHSKNLDEAVNMINTEPGRFNVVVEPRLYSQLIQSCVRARQGRRAFEVYKVFIERGTPTASLHSAILSVCVRLNMFDSAVEFLEMIAARNFQVDARDVRLVLRAAEKKKKKSCCVESIVAAARKLGISVETDTYAADVQF